MTHLRLPKLITSAKTQSLNKVTFTGSGRLVFWESPLHSLTLWTAFLCMRRGKGSLLQAQEAGGVSPGLGQASSQEINFTSDGEMGQTATTFERTKRRL